MSKSTLSRPTDATKPNASAIVRTNLRSARENIGDAYQGAADAMLAGLDFADGDTASRARVLAAAEVTFRGLLHARRSVEDAERATGKGGAS